MLNSIRGVLRGALSAAHHSALIGMGRKLRSLIASALLLMTGWSATAGPRPDPIYSREFKGLYACAHDRILAGPDGEVAIWWGDDHQILGSSIRAPGQLIVGRMHDRARKGDDRLYLYVGGGHPFYPVRWAGRDGLLFIRTRGPESRILSIDARGGPVREMATLDPAWRAISLDSVGHGTVDALFEPSAAARARQVDGRTLIRGHATLGSKLDMVGARRSDLELVRIGETSTEAVGIGAENTWSLTLFPDARVYPNGIAYLGAPSNGRFRYLPYQLPLVDQSTGEIAGKFGPGGILLAAESRLSRSLAQFRRSHKDSRIILDVSMSGQTLVALTLSGRGNRAIVRISPDGISEQPICTDVVATDFQPKRAPNPLVSADTAYRPLFRTFVLDARGRETKEAGGPVVALHRLSDGSPRDAILYFHGGPGGSHATSDYQLLQLGSLLSSARDIVAIEYSGSVGGGGALTRRLGEQGLAALEQDMDAIVRWLDRKGYRRVFIVGGSFGGVPALVALDRHRARFSAAFLFAPLLKLPDPADHSNRGRFDSVSPDTQLSYERAMLGGDAGRERFKLQLAALVKRVPLRATDHFYFAERDPVSRSSDLPPGSAATFEVVPRTNHAVIMAVPAIWKAIEEQMR
jgi:pimeloyl-ACP methyl ester carboxylesterase